MVIIDLLNQEYKSHTHYSIFFSCLTSICHTLGTDLKNKSLIVVNLCAAFMETDWPARMLNPTDPLWEADSRLHLGNILGCGARRPSVPQSASELSNHQDAPPLCSAKPGRWEDDAVLLKIQHSALKKKNTGIVYILAKY